MNDTWEIYKNNLRKWRWRRITPNGDVVGSGPRGYKNKADCEANARYNGWKTEDARDQDLVETLTQKANEQREDGQSTDFDPSIGATGMEQKSAKGSYGKKPFIQQNLLKLIATFLGLMLMVLILILFKPDPEPKLSDNGKQDMHSLINSEISGDSEFMNTGLPCGLFTC